MSASVSLGVRLPEELLVRVDGYRVQAGVRTRSEAILNLVELGLAKAGTGGTALRGGQDRSTGAAASKWGHETADRIAAVLQAKRLSNNSNEFSLDGKRITIRCARPRTTSVGLTNAMRERIDFVYAGFQAPDGHFDLYRITPAVWKQHCRDVTEGHQNHGRVTLFSRSMFQQLGEDLGQVELE